LRAAWERLAALEAGRSLAERFVGETICLIYAPIEDLGGKEAALARGENEGAVSLTGIRFLPLRCPECNADLDASPGALGLGCSNCGRLWWFGAGEPVAIDYELGGSANGAAVALPFWKIGFQAEGLPLSDQGDLMQHAGAYARASAASGLPLHVFVPGFKVHPASMLRISRQLTCLELPEPVEGARGCGLRFEPVRLSATEAAEALLVVLAGMLRSPRQMRLQLPHASIRPVSLSLRYQVFHPSGRDLVEASSGYAIPKASISFGANL